MFPIMFYLSSIKFCIVFYANILLLNLLVLIIFPRFPAALVTGVGSPFPEGLLSIDADSCLIEVILLSKTCFSFSRFAIKSCCTFLLLSCYSTYYLTDLISCYNFSILLVASIVSSWDFASSVNSKSIFSICS